MANLYPTFDVPSVLDGQQEVKKAVKSWHFDSEKGDFMTDGGNKVIKADEWTTWAQWCMKVLQIERFACLAYSGQIGIESEEIRSQTTREAAQSILEKNVTEALQVHPSTELVNDFKYTWETDKLKAQFTVYPTDGVPFTASTTIIL